MSRGGHKCPTRELLAKRVRRKQTHRQMEQRSEASEKKRSRRKRSPVLYRYIEVGQGAAILSMLVVSPWLFGTTEDWAIHLMNGVAYGLGALLVIKKIVALFYRDLLPPKPAQSVSSKAFGWSLNLLIAALLTYILVSALNARATYVFQEQRFEYHESYNPSWPHSYDSEATWTSFWQYLGIALFFWSLRDWLLSDSKAVSAGGDGRASSALTPRLNTLFWVLCVNGSLVALQAVLQRLSGSTHLLWLRESYGQNSINCFGPFSYRSNAAQYLNLIWPVTIGLWLTLRSEFKRRHLSARAGEGAHLVLVPLAGITAIGPIISLSRGGALIAGFLLGSIFLLLLFSKRLSAGGRIATITVFLFILASAAILAWPQLKLRFATLEKDQWSNRGEIYENAKQITLDYPVFGTGAGTFSSVYHLYRQSTRQRWHSVVHDDWLEARVTLGWVGFSVGLSILVLSIVRFVFTRGLPLSDLLAGTLVLAIIGCAVHAKFDFPFQIYSILLLFVTYCGILSVSSAERD
jgi:O-antigen ligase